jgi:hypothetical protein
MAASRSRCCSSRVSPRSASRPCRARRGPVPFPGDAAADRPRRVRGARHRPRWRLLLAAIRRIDSSIRRDPTAAAGAISDADLGSLVRAVRLVFLAAASFTAAAGWLIGDPLPLVIALVIAGVDVVETSFLLLVATRRSR